MDIRKAINKLLTEDRKHEFGCAMLYFDFPEIKQIHSLIDKNDLYIDVEDPTFGLETQPHCTLLFGLHEEITTEDIKTILDKYSFPPLELNNPSFFEVDDLYDVLKFEVINKNLHTINKELRKYPHTNDYPDYKPHCTIAYVQPGLGKKYVDLLNKQKFTQFELQPSYAIYSKPDGEEDKININID